MGSNLGAGHLVGDEEVHGDVVGKMEEAVREGGGLAELEVHLEEGEGQAVRQEEEAHPAGCLGEVQEALEESDQGAWEVEWLECQQLQGPGQGGEVYLQLLKAG